ncbi:hypothetical protein ACFQS7_02400 [Dankookia sp. GCM10030260]|uniref:hypothetical protein n=1 Tax=Dankookia sp. GCM10030260 TaxID=3273390 RepID=UPI00360DA272
MDGGAALDRLAARTLDIRGIARPLGTVMDLTAGDLPFRAGKWPRGMEILLARAAL